MKINDYLFLTTRNVRRRPMRQMLTVLGVSIGIGTILFLVSLGFGLQQLLLERITTSEILLSLDIAPPAGSAVSLDEKAVEEISQIENVTTVAPVAVFGGQVTHKELTNSVAVRAVDTGHFRLNGINLLAGDSLDPNAEKPEVIASKITLTLLGLDDPEKAIGETMNLIMFVELKNENGLNPGGQNVKIVEFDEPFVIRGVTDSETSSEIFINREIVPVPITEFAQAKVLVNSEPNLAKVRDELVNRGFIVSAISDLIEQANKIFRAMQFVLFVFGFAALFVAAVGMFNTMTIALMERTKEIGVMRVLGASARDTGLLFLGESMLIGIGGGVGGVVLSYMLQFVVNTVFNILARSLGGQPLSLFATPILFIGAIVGLSTFVGLLTGVVPARRAAKLNPLDALRYK